MRWYWNLSNGIKSENCMCWLTVEIGSNQLQSTEFVTYLDATKKKKVYFQYHLNCLDITERWGYIELCLMGSNRKTVSASWQLKFDQSNVVIQRNLLLRFMQLNKRNCIFNSTSIFRILLTNEVILNFV